MVRVFDWIKYPRSRGVIILSVCCVLLILWAVIILATDDRHNLHPTKRVGGYTYEKHDFDRMITEFPELMWLTGAQEACAFLPAGVSCIRIFGEESTPFDYAVKAIRAVDLFVQGEYPDYLEFVSVMSPDHRLLWDQFLTAKNQINFVIEHMSSLTRQEIIDALKLSIILSEMGDSKLLKTKAWIYQIALDCENGLLMKVIDTHPEMFPSFSKMSLKQKQLVLGLLKSIHLDRLFSFTSLYQVMKEIDETSLVKKNRDLFELITFIHQCRISGRDLTSDHSTRGGLEDRVFENHQLFRQANLICASSSLQEGYQFYLLGRSHWMGLDLSTPLHRVLTFMGSILNCYSPAEGEIIKETFLALSPQDISLLVDELETLSTTESDFTQYFSGVITQLQKNSKLGRSQEERLSNTIHLGFPFLSKLCFLTHSGEVHSEQPLDFMELSQAAKQNPDLFRQCKPIIDKMGKVHLK